MPASYAHYRFGCEVFALLPQAVQTRIAPFRGLFEIGLHGPDIFFFTNPFLKNTVNRTGRDLHHSSGSRVFRLFTALDDGSDRSFAYLAGFLCHFALDSMCHGYVEEMTALGMSHNRLETQLDRSLMLEDGKDPLTTHPTAHLVPSASNAETVGRFFPQFSLHTVQRTLKHMQFYHHVLLADSAPKRMVLDLGCRIIGAEDTFGAMVMTTTDLSACKQMVARLRLLYRQALPPAVSMISAWPDRSHPQFRFDFDGGLHETEPTGKGMDPV